LVNLQSGASLDLKNRESIDAKTHMFSADEGITPMRMVVIQMRRAISRSSNAVWKQTCNLIYQGQVENVSS
jgi:hypothetical protein